MSENIREIPYNYTSYSDREIIIRFLGEESWDDLNVLRSQRRTGRSARMLFEILGDLWMVERNVYLKNELLKRHGKRKRMQQRHTLRLQRIVAGASDNPRALKVAARVEHALEQFNRWFTDEPARRKQVTRAFSRYTHRNNIHFDAYTLTHHATDATDWRSHLPFCVLTPDKAEEIPGLVRAAQAQDLIIIPRGGGTGLCGGSVPLNDQSVMFNMEKLDHIGEVEIRDVCRMPDQPAREEATIRVGAGAVTGRVMEASLPHVFATDPTSLWACTIGGNVASNAGGKHAVIWGTCLDNLLAWKMIDAQGHWLEVERLDHQMDKVHLLDEALFRIRRVDGETAALLSDETLHIPGHVFRTQGLGKDVTRKAMRGLPGIQKEGCDGMVVEATFVLHRSYAHTRTVCCEFFGQDLGEATAAMVGIKHALDALDGAYIEGFEHFDEKYVKAIDYISKSSRPDRPKMVLLIDVSGDEEQAVAEGAALAARLTSQGNGEGFVAVQIADRDAFWADRTRMAAIARHTKAFKLNEDVVIPLDRLSEYNDCVERLNIENSIDNKMEMVTEIELFIDDLRKKLQSDNAHVRESLGISDGAFLHEKLNECDLLLSSARMGWKCLRKGLDLPAEDLGLLLHDVEEYSPDESLFRVIQRGAKRISYRQEVEHPLLERLRGYDVLCKKITAIHQRVLSGRIVIATHMHAGDGNVHTNIPVNSNNYMMMKQAHHTVELIMRKAEALGGVISGEHGIGITKLPYLNQQSLAEVADYLRQVDPEHLFNRGKLMPDTKLGLTYTPSFNLLEHEAVILEAADITELADVISPCLRCGKCKPVCNTHFPRSNLLYSPRNKIQASAAIIEAFLYESQTGEEIAFEQFNAMGEIADHCTICHKCEKPCPVNIDFGEVSERMRALLSNRNQKPRNIGTRLAMTFLALRQPDAVNIMRKGLVQWGGAAQRTLHELAKRSGLLKQKPLERRNLEGIQAQVISFVERPLKQPPAQTARRMLGIESRDKNMIPILRSPTIKSSRAVFYFPGCGSERLYSQVGLATQSMLYNLGIHVVLPPSYVCCGYPATAGGDVKSGQRMVYDNRIMLHRLKNALSYLDFEAVIVSCGTCYDQLENYHLEQVFPDAPLIDIHEYLIEQNIDVSSLSGQSYVYHEPCHTPLKQHGSAVAVERLFGGEAIASESCCGEAGTMAVSSPDIAARIRMRKEEELQRNVAQLQATTDSETKTGGKILTSCPSCLQGLGRLEEESGLTADYMVVELARRLHGEDWQEAFIQRVKQGGIERVLM
ncbi:MAG: DUF3683 domain-containing protein [Mariprofundaceae bacterium]|nr:DUF3683 domain-containing protein [Mariprofundaceae bacterium]